MKHWTVMLIPDHQGSTRTLSVCSLHFTSVVALFAILAFMSTFFFSRHQTMLAQAEKLREAYRSVATSQSQQQPPVIVQEGISQEELHEIQAQMRAEYEASISAITAELGQLREVEAKARDIHGISPRKVRRSEDVGASLELGGKGGAPGTIGLLAYSGIEAAMRPPQVIDGLSRPSADLILQEIRLRSDSLEQLRDDLLVRRDAVERMPSVWPVASNAGRISSHFGYRRDPLHHRIRHHDGTDIAAKTGTPVLATGKGTVSGSYFDKYLGNVVKIDHGNGLETWYAHLHKRLVDEGGIVDRRQPIGEIGSTGRSTGPHLHYEVHKNGKPVDGMKYLND